MFEENTVQLCLLIGSENFTFSKEHFLSQPNCCWRNKKHRLEKKIKKSLSIGVNVNSLLLFRCKVNVFYKQLQLFSHSKCPLSRGLSWCLLILLISRWQQEKYSFHFSGLGSAKFGKAMYNIHKSVRCCVLRSHKETTLCTFRELGTRFPLPLALSTKILVMSGCFSLHAVISWKLPHAHSKRSDNCSFPVNIAFSISSLDILIASVAVFPKFCHHCDWGTLVCGQFCLKRLRCPLNEDCELKASELMNVSLLPEWRCLFRNKKVIPTSLRGPKFCLKKFNWIHLDFEFVVCFCKKFFAESKNGVVLKIVFPLPW